MTNNTILSSRWNPWPVSIIGLFSVAIIGCVTFVIYCSHHPADLVAADYYEQEVRYQGQMDSQLNAQQRAPNATVRYDAARQCLTISLPPAHALAKATGTIQLYRPSALNQDRQLKLALNAEGVQTLDARTLLPGLWKVRISWVVENRDFYLDAKVVVGPQA